MLHFSINCLGWLDCVIITKERKIKISHSSDYGDKFQELINVFFLLITVDAEKSWKQPYNTEEISWCDDFSFYIWQIKHHESEMINITIRESYVENLAHNSIIINFDISISNLSLQLFNSLKELYELFGFSGYKWAWEVGNFPVAEYIELSAKHKGLTLKELPVFKEDIEGLKRLIVDDEIKLLM